MKPAHWFMATIAVLNLGACFTWLWKGNPYWSLIYFGATCIAVGSIGATR